MTVIENKTLHNDLNRAEAVPSVRFSPSRGGLLSMTLTDEEGEHVFDRVIVLRAVPLTSPDEFLSVREPTGGREELYMIRRLSELDEESARLVSEELASRYYIPRITRIYSLHRRRMFFLDAETDLGRRKITMQGHAGAVRLLEDGRVLLSDLDGNLYEIPDPKALSKADYRKIEVLL